MQSRILTTMGILIPTLCIYALTFQSPSHSTAPIHPTTIDSLVQRLVFDHQTAGVTYALQIGEHEPIVKAYGLADVSTKRPVTSTDLFRTGSVTKPITAIAIMQLVESNQLSLTDSISRFFPYFPGGEEITIYQLLSHTSGIPNWWEGELPSETPADFPMCARPHQYIANMATPSFFEPGTHWYYSNTGYVLLGEIIEHVSGLSYEAYLKKHMIEPLGLRHTEIEYIDHPSLRWVEGYAYDATLDTPFTTPDRYHLPYSAGAIRSNAADLLAILHAFISGQLLNKATVEAMTTYAKVNDGRTVDEAFFFPEGFTPPPPLPHLQKMGYGLGFNLYEAHGESVIMHSGGIAGFNAIMLYVPSQDTYLVLLANTENGLIPQWSTIEKMVTIGA